MNPDPYALSIIAARHAREERHREARQAELHRAAVARRRKAKRGGRR
ncbi:hypothetical protein [Agromyces sp. NPDC058104]